MADEHKEKEQAALNRARQANLVNRLVSEKGMAPYDASKTAAEFVKKNPAPVPK